jgi:hypothetical protein
VDDIRNFPFISENSWTFCLFLIEKENDDIILCSIVFIENHIALLWPHLSTSSEIGQHMPCSN